MRAAVRQLLDRLARDARGIAAMEFALILPMLLMFSVGTIEYSRLILLTQKLQSGSFILADLTARDKTLSEDQLANIFLAIDNIIQPFDFAGDGKAIVTSIGVDASNNVVVNWQRDGSGSLVASSQVGSEAEGATLPDDLDIVQGETVIAAEVFYSFQPLFGIGVSPRVIRKVAFFKPRLGTLDALEPATCKPAHASSLGRKSEIAGKATRSTKRTISEAKKGMTPLAPVRTPAPDTRRRARAWRGWSRRCRW